MQVDDIKPGTVIGSYVVEKLVATGGSAVVYKATHLDTGCPTALKLLLDTAFVSDNGGQRFLHEARAYTCLKHPNIVTLYEIGEFDGRPFLAMEWVDGHTLADLFSASRIKENEILSLMTQVADALSAAHGLGLAHRDLKPANIMMTDDGHIKLVDFGLVKQVKESSGENPSLATADGVVLGTPGYMSPEQVRGEKITLSSDVFCFGIVLYEALTGNSPFSRSHLIDALNAIAAVDYTPLPRARSRRIRELHGLAENCLAADPAERPQDARELVVLLNALTRDKKRLEPKTSLKFIVAAVLCGVLLGALSHELVHRRNQLPSPRAGVHALAVEGKFPRVLKDGSAVVYCSNNQREIWVAPLETGNPELIWGGAYAINSLSVNRNQDTVVFSAAGNDRQSFVYAVPFSGGLARRIGQGWAPVFSPDSDHLAFFQSFGRQEVALMSCLSDGTERRVLYRFGSSMTPRGVAFTPEGSEIVVLLTDGLHWSRLVTVDAVTGRLRLVAEKEGVATPGIAVLPSVMGVLWCVTNAPEGQAMLSLTSLDGGRTSPFYPGPGELSRPSISEDGSVLIAQVREPLLEIVEIDIDAPSESGSELRVLPNTQGGLQPRVSPDGSRVVFVSARNDLWILDRSNGSVGPLLTTGEAAFNPSWSPDGKAIAYSCLKGGQSEIWMAAADGSSPVPLTDTPDNEFQPVWHPDGEHLLFISDRDGPEDLYCMTLKTGVVVRLGQDTAANPAISPDGDLVVFATKGKGEKVSLRLCRLSVGCDSLRPIWERGVVVNSWAGAKPRFSPDGQWIAFDQPVDPIGAEILAVSTISGGSGPARRLTNLPFPARLKGWFDWAHDGSLVVSVSRNPIRMILMKDARNWIAQAAH